MKSITFLSKTYEVHYVPQEELIGDDSVYLFGRCNHSRQTIAINTDIHEQQQEDTLLHELIHVIEYNSGIFLKEREVTGLAGGLVHMIKANPQFKEWLNKL